MAKLNPLNAGPLLVGDVYHPQRAQPLAVAAAALLHESLGPALLVSVRGAVVQQNAAAALLTEDAACRAELLRLASVIAASGEPAFADLSTRASPARRFHVRGLLLAGEPDLVWLSGCELSVQDHLIAALRESRTMFRDLAEAAGDFCIEVDCAGIVRYVTPEGALGHEAWMLNGNTITLLGEAAVDMVCRTRIGPRDVIVVDQAGQPRCLSFVAAPVVQAGAWTGTRIIARDVTQERADAVAAQRAHAAQLESLERLSRTDALTGLANRRGFEEEVQRRVASLERHGGEGTMLVLDLDHFKQLNDTLGHGAGDEALRALARILQETLRDTDLVARLGGDEFALWLDGSSAQGGKRVAATIMERMTRVRQLVGGGVVPLSVSIGIAEWTRGVSDMHILLRRADDALYRVKRAGRSAFEVWTDA